MAVKRTLDFRVAIFFLLLLSSVHVFAAPPAPIILDHADLLTEEEERALYKVMEPIREFGGVAFVTHIDEYMGEASDLAAGYYDILFLEGESGVVFLLDMHKRRIEFYAEGEIYELAGSMWYNVIADNIYQYATDRQYFTCAREGFLQLYTVLQGGKVAAPMRYVSSILFSVAVTLLLMFFFLYVSRCRKSLGKTVRLLTGNHTPWENLNVELLEKEKTGESKRYHSSGSSGGRRLGGGGYRSGGGRSGGGGGHGF